MTGGQCVPLSTLSVQKEILLRVLHYIHYLQRNIDMAKALLKLHSSDGKGGFVGKQLHLQCLYTQLPVSGKPTGYLLLPWEGATAKQCKGERGGVGEPDVWLTPVTSAFRGWGRKTALSSRSAQATQ